MTLKIKFEQDSFTAGNERFNIFKRQILEPNRFDFVCGFTDGAKWYKDKQDEFAIEFSEWTHNLRDCEEDSIEFNQYINISSEELLKIFKKEKGL